LDDGQRVIWRQASCGRTGNSKRGKPERLNCENALYFCD
jgi:hypothetical protein